MNLKRLWDTENKKTVRAIPTGDPHKKFQVWTDDDGSHLYVYANSKYEELNTANADVSEYGPTVWKTLDDETVGYYLTNEPTDLYNWDEGDDVTYTFKDYNGTVLKTGKVEEGQTPTPPADPTRAATAQYTYTFAGWNPTVGPISKKTTYTATYTRTVNKYTITATSSDADLGTVSPASVANVEYGTALTVADNVITVGTGESAPTITATAGEGNTFDGWLDWRTGLLIPSTVTGDLTVEAEFTAPMITVTFAVDPADSGCIYEGDWETEATTATFPVGTEVTVIVGQDTSIQFDTPDEDHVEYFPGSDYQFLGAFIGETEITDTPVTLTEDVTITAKFDVPPMHTVTISATNVYSGNAGYEVAESQNPLRATREPVSIQVPEGSIINYDFNLTDEQIDAGIRSIDFVLSGQDEPSGTILFTTTIVEGFESYLDLNVEAVEETEGLEEINGEYTITGDAVLPVYLVREATA